MKEHYLDYAATTPVDKEVFKVMEPYLKNKYGNPSSIYSKGQEARIAIEEVREKIGTLIGADPSEIIFTSCATESNNLAIKGVSFYPQTKKEGNHIITSSIEHHSVEEAVKYLKDNFGFRVTYLPVSSGGIVSSEDVKKAIIDSTVLVSIMFANNEIGAIQPIKEIGEIIKDINKIREAKKKPPIYFHTDAVQAVQYLDIDIKNLGVDFLSITGHKFYAPKGIGALYVKRGTQFLPQQNGGSQEKHRRAGTENVASIIGMAKALELAYERKEKGNKHLKRLQDKLIAEITKIPDTLLAGDREKRLPHIAGFVFKYIEGESLVLKLNARGFCVSTGSACTSDSLKPSHVITALGIEPRIAQGSLRVSLGIDTTDDDVNAFCKVLPGVVEELKDMSSVTKDY